MADTTPLTWRKSVSRGCSVLQARDLVLSEEMQVSCGMIVG